MNELLSADVLEGGTKSIKPPFFQPRTPKLHRIRHDIDEMN